MSKATLPRRLLTVSTMKALENRGEEIGITRMMMMENAGASIARYVHNHFFRENERIDTQAKSVKVLFVAGTGNNGGDAFVAARHLAYWPGKFEITVALIGEKLNVKALEARKNLEVLSAIPSIRKLRIKNIKQVGKLQTELNRATVVISAVFGTGFKGKPRKLQSLVISRINNIQTALKVSVDVPSGMEADSGSCEFAVDSDVTISMHAIKKGMLRSQSARQKCGEIIIENIGLPF